MIPDRSLILDALDAITGIERYTGEGRDEFDRSELVQVWVIHQLQILGEALGRVSVETRSAWPEIPWAQIKALRNIVVHEYGNVDRDVIWNTVVRGIPELKSNLSRFIRSTDSNDSEEGPV